MVRKEGQQRLRSMNIKQRLDRRLELSMAQYDRLLEKSRELKFGTRNMVVDAQFISEARNDPRPADPAAQADQRVPSRIRVGIVSRTYETIRVRLDDGIAVVQIHRPDADNAINSRLIEEVGDVLRACEAGAKVVVLEGLPEVFCSGADFGEIQARFDHDGPGHGEDPGPLYDLWQRLASGPTSPSPTCAARANAGGVGFVAACDLVLATRRRHSACRSCCSA